MNHLLAPTLTLLALLGIAAGPASALEADKVFEKISPSVWMVLTSDARERLIGVGSAVVIGQGRLVTNCHVLAKAQAVYLRRKNVLYQAKLEHADAPRDLCLLTVENFSAPAVNIAPRESVMVGEKVFAIGNPAGYESTLSEGLISGLRGEWPDGSHVLQTTAPISPGSSGGGLFDSEGRLVGITSSGVVGVGAQNLNFALPAHWIAEVPQRAEAALAKRKQAQSAATLAMTASAAPPGYPAAGTVWVYRMTERSNHNRVSQVTVKAESVDKDFIEETLVLLGGNVAPQRRTVGIQQTGFLLYPLGGESAFLELAPYLLAPSGGKEPKEAIVPAGYPSQVGLLGPGRDRESWSTKVVPPEWEEVKVPAGTYRALRYEVSGKSDVPAVSGNMGVRIQEFKIEVWYAPQIRRIVKLEHRAWGFNPVPYNDDEIELMEYRPPQ